MAEDTVLEQPTEPTTPQPKGEEKRTTLKQMNDALHFSLEHLKAAEQHANLMDQLARDARKKVQQIIAWQKNCEVRLRDIPLGLQPPIRDLFDKAWSRLQSAMQEAGEEFQVIDLDMDQGEDIPW